MYASSVYQVSTIIITGLAHPNGNTTTNNNNNNVITSILDQMDHYQKENGHRENRTTVKITFIYKPERSVQ